MLMNFVLHSFSHQQTERYIPIGQSPGLSKKYTYIGRVIATNKSHRTLTVSDQGVERIIKISNKTKIWLDRSNIKKTNLSGKISHIKKNRRVEIKYSDYKRKNSAEWIKIEVNQ